MKRIPVRRNAQGVAGIDDRELGTLAAICSEIEIWCWLPNSVRPTSQRSRRRDAIQR